MSDPQTPQRPGAPAEGGAPRAGSMQALRERLAASSTAHCAGAERTAPAPDQAAPADAGVRTPEAVGGDAAAQLARKYGVDADSAKVVESARSLATEDGRRAAMQELGVHMSGKLAEKYGIQDAEAAKLLESSRALRTREGRQNMLAEYGGNLEAEDLMARMHERGLTIDDRRELVNSLLRNDMVTGTLKKAGKGLVIGAIVLLVVLAAVLIGAVALLGWLFQTGGGDASALAEAISTRPASALFAPPLGSA